MSELVEIALRHTRSGTAAFPTRIPLLQINRSDTHSQRVHAVQRPSLCFMAQGAKQMTVAGKIYRYAASDYVLSTVDLPITGEVLEATARRPYLSYMLAIDPADVYEVLRHANLDPPSTPQRAVYVSRAAPLLTDAMLRLARCLDAPSDCSVLAPGIVREIVYRLLQGPFGSIVRDLGVVGSRTQRLSKAIEHLKNAFAEPLQVEELARLAGMSTSSFHEHFKKVTTLSPVQYQKQLRLQEARRLLLLEGSGAADVGFRVGYQSPSQFSREYARFFGRPPMHDVRAKSA